MKNINVSFDRPASDWNEALPIGNGFMGAMCFGGNLVDRFQLNADSLWYGKFRNRVNKDAKNKLSDIRKLIFDGKIREAEELCDEALGAVPEYQCHYEPLCDIFFLEETEERIHVLGLKDGWNHEMYRFVPCNDYKRNLNLEDGIHSVEYNLDGVKHKRECFISYPDRVMAIKALGKPFRVIMERGSYAGDLIIEDNSIYMKGQAGGEGVVYSVGIRVIKGYVKTVGRTLHLSEDAEILVASDTSFYSDNPLDSVRDILNKAEAYGYEGLRERHVADFSELMNRCQIFIEGQEKVCCAFNFGRYLLISSSRPGSLPANLQGIWNKDFLPPWDSKYTININTEMNYWPAEITNLSELTEPLFTHIKRMYEKGKAVAREMYGVEGFVAHHNTDIWGDCAPQDTCISATYWQMGAVWLCIHAMEHYEFSGDESFLNEMLPIVKDAVLFFENTLIKNDDGELVVSPTISPENTYILENGESGNICHGAAMDSQILRELLGHLLKLESRLSEEEICRYKRLYDGLSKDKIGSDGRILEWAKPYKEAEPGHRHVSHLFGIFPGTTLLEEDFMKASYKTLEYRLKHGGGHTGWSIAWIICLYARLLQGDKAQKALNKYFDNSVLPNGFCNHPPFQIDGNFGVTAGICEMLMQSQNGEIKLLPAIPKSWKKGYVKGFRTRNGRTVSFTFENGNIVNLEII